jgi:predicted nucleotidyltransferase component of viral defense system
MADIRASILAKLRNKAKASGASYQHCLQLFFQEEFLRRLSKSEYVDYLILKGGLFIYTLTNFESRATIDVDFLLRQQSNSLDDVRNMINEILKRRKSTLIPLKAQYQKNSTLSCNVMNSPGA